MLASDLMVLLWLYIVMADVCHVSSHKATHGSNLSHISLFQIWHFLLLSVAFCFWESVA